MNRENLHHPTAEGLGPADLAVVMPAYNEQDCILAVVRDWLGVLGSTVPRFELLVLNDGSKDRTFERLARLQEESRLTIVNKPNEGHGPTILRGYRQAVERAPWVFQVDSDDEMPASSFPALWAMRDAYDFILGVRAGRTQAPSRAAVSAASRLVVRLLSGGNVANVNSPYRLMRSDWLRKAVARIPPDTFAPNVILSALAVRERLRIGTLEVPHQGRRTGTGSLNRLSLARNSARAFCQTIRLLKKIRS